MPEGLSLFSAALPMRITEYAEYGRIVPYGLIPSANRRVCICKSQAQERDFIIGRPNPP